MEPRHAFSWSVARRATFDTCRRRYWFAHDLARTGWKHEAAAERREAWRLGQLTRFEPFADECVRRALAHWFEMRGHGITGGAQEVEAHAVRLFRDGFRESRDEVTGGVRFAEHHYAEAAAAEDRVADHAGRTVDRMRRSIRTFFGADELEPAREAEPATYLGLGARSFELGGVPVHVTPEFAHAEREHGPRRVRIYDWGPCAGADRFPLALAALFAREALGLDPHQVRVVAADLARDRTRVEAFTSEDLRAAEEEVLRSLEEMHVLHVGDDLAASDPERFPRLEENDLACGTCPFRRPCGREPSRGAGDSA